MGAEAGAHGNDRSALRERHGRGRSSRKQLQAGELREALKHELCHQGLVGPCGPAGSSPRAAPCVHRPVTEITRMLVPDSAQVTVSEGSLVLEREG